MAGGGNRNSITKKSTMGRGAKAKNSGGGDRSSGGGAAAKKQKNYRLNSPYVSRSLYTTLIKMDRDKDLTACEK